MNARLKMHTLLFFYFDNVVHLRLTLVLVSRLALVFALGTGPWLMPYIANATSNPYVTTPTPSSFFGMHISRATDWPNLPTIISARGKCSRTTWPYLEPAPGIYSWIDLDYCLSVTQFHKASLFYSSDCTNSSLCQGGAAPTGLGIPNWTTCSNLARDYRNFYTALVSRYGSNLIYELWNEPGSVGCASAQLTAAINAAHNVVRSLAPTGIILAPSWVGASSSDYLKSQIQNFYANGGTHDVDGWTLHSYPRTPEGFLSDLSIYDSIYSAYPDVYRRPIWMTEGSAYGTILPTAGVMAAYVSRYYLLMWAKGITRGYWYEWDAWGTIMGYPAAVTAFDQTENWIIGATNPMLYVNGSVYTVTMLRNGHPQMAVWNTAGSSTFALPSGYIQCSDLFGNTTRLNGVTTVTIGTSPILLKKPNISNALRR